MALITRNTKAVAEYQQWIATDITNGDILGIWESLGNREARTVTIESAGGITTLRFNVVTKVYKEHGESHNTWIGMGSGSSRSSPYLIGEVKQITPLVTISNNVTQLWTADELSVRDIEIVSKALNLRITVT